MEFKENLPVCRSRSLLVAKLICVSILIEVRLTALLTSITPLKCRILLMKLCKKYGREIMQHGYRQSNTGLEPQVCCTSA